MKRLRWEVKKGATHDRLFAQASGLDSPASQVKQKLGMGMLVGFDFVALIGVLVVGESLDLVPGERQGEILQEYGLYLLFFHRRNGLTKKMSQKC